jgi:hypothetical protein
MAQHCPVQESCTEQALGVNESTALMALVGGAQHTEEAYAALHTGVEEEAVAVGEPAVVDVMGPVAACYDAASVPVGIECPSRNPSHSTLALLPWHDRRRWSRHQ